MKVLRTFCETCVLFRAWLKVLYSWIERKKGKKSFFKFQSRIIQTNCTKWTYLSFPMKNARMIMETTRSQTTWSVLETRPPLILVRFDALAKDWIIVPLHVQIQNLVSRWQFFKEPTLFGVQNQIEKLFPCVASSGNQRFYNFSMFFLQRLKWVNFWVFMCREIPAALCGW